MTYLTYGDALHAAMGQLGEANYIFLGQGVEYGGHGMSRSLVDINPDQKIELPVFEETQMGISLGMALAGDKVISIYPRFDFLLAACNQLVNHADKIALMSGGHFTPTLIVRTGVGSTEPLNGGPQHTQNHSEAFKLLLPFSNVWEIEKTQNPLTVYGNILNKKGIHLVIEHFDFYGIAVNY